MAYLDEISIAVAPYVSRTQKAIEFYKNNKDLDSNNEKGGLFLCLGQEPDKESSWTNGIVPLPDLNTFDVENPLKFIRYKYMYFVVSDIDGKINVGNLTWTRVASGSNEDEYFLNVINKCSRWLYVQFEIEQDQKIDEYIKQIGIYGDLKIKSSVNDQTITKTYFDPSDISQVSTAGNRLYDGYLQLIQNVEPFQKNNNSKLIYSFVLEF